MRRVNGRSSPGVLLNQVDEPEVHHGEHDSEDSSETMNENVVETKPLIERAREEPEVYGPLLAYADLHDREKHHAQNGDNKEADKTTEPVKELVKGPTGKN